MSEQKSLISKAFQTFLTEAPEQAQAWGALVQSLAQASALEAKTGALAYLAVFAALDDWQRHMSSVGGIGDFLPVAAVHSIFA